MHGLHKMFYVGRKEVFTYYFYYIFHGYLFAAMFIFLSRFLDCPLWNASAIVIRCYSILDIAGVLNPLQYASTCIVYTNYILLQVPEERKITTGHCKYSLWPLYLVFKIRHQSINTWYICRVEYKFNTK